MYTVYMYVYIDSNICGDRTWNHMGMNVECAFATVVMQFVLNYKNLVISNPDLRVFSWYNLGGQHKIQGKFEASTAWKMLPLMLLQKNIKNILY